MWLFVSNGTHSDTIEFYLADDRGQWLGADKNGFIEMPILFDASRHYPDTGFYQLSIQHGMRDTLLRGVMDVGLEIAVSDKE
jgi:gliding motility-associated lipoprotein GldH